MENQDKKPKKKILPIILAVVAIIGLIYGVKKYVYAQGHEDTDDAQIEGDISPVLPRVAGYVSKIYFEDNQPVKAGDTLLSIDDKDLRIKVEQAQAALDNSQASVLVVRANVGSSNATVEGSKASVENAKIRLAKAQKDFTRYEKLIADKSITQQQYDNAKAEKDVAESQLKLAEKQLATTESQVHGSQEQVKVGESTVKQRVTDLDYAKLQLSYATVIAPISGVVSKKNVQPGQYIQPGQSLCSIVGSDEIWVVANFKETQLKKMKIGQEVEVEVDAFGTEVKGTVESFAGATGARFSLLPPDNATGNFVKVVQRVPVKIKLATTPEMLTALRPGLSVRATVNVK